MPHPTAKSILDALYEARNRRPEAAEWTYPSAMTVWWVPVPPMRRIAKDTAKALHDADPAVVYALAEELIASNNLEARIVAYELYAALPVARRALSAKQIETLGTGNDNWKTVDYYATCLTGPAWIAGELTDATLRKWAKSPDMWWRRTAAASTVMLNTKARGGSGDTGRTLMICALLAADTEPLVYKAVSWALRSQVHWDRAAVIAFLEAHDAVLAAQVKRETKKKLTTGKKNG